MIDQSLAHPAHPEPEDRSDPKRTAKVLARILAGGCIDCGISGADAELYPVPDDHLTFFGGDELCRECARDHGVL